MGSEVWAPNFPKNKIKIKKSKLYFIFSFKKLLLMEKVLRLKYFEYVF